MRTKTEVGVNKLFENRPTIHKLFESLQMDIEALGDVEASATKTQIAYGARRKFAWLWLAPATRKNPEGILMLTLDMKEKVSHPLIENVEESYKDKWTHQIPIKDEADIEAVVKQGWLKDAYAFGTMAR